MEETKVKKKFNRRQKYLLLRSMIILLVLLVVNTFAWFLMSTRTALSLNVHIDSWQVTITDENDVESEVFEIVVDRAYPGMPEFTKVFTITNTGERDAELVYSVIEARLLEDTYTVDPDNGPTHDEIEDMLENDLPFHFSFDFSNDELSHTTGNNQETFTLTLTWDYEASDPAEIDAKDELDTQWGEDVYDYYEDHKDDPAPATVGDDTRYPIYLKINVIAQQAN